MIKYNRNRSIKVLEGVNIAFGNAAVHERAMCFYSNMYKITKLKWCEEKFNEHKAAAIV